MTREREWEITDTLAEPGSSDGAADGWLSRVLARQIAAADDTQTRVPTVALLLSLLCLAVPVVGAALLPGVMASDPGLLVWILVLVPPFLLSYYRGWRGAALALALGMAAVSLSSAAIVLLDVRPPSYLVLAAAVAALVVVSVGSGILSSIFQHALAAARDEALIDPRTGLPNRAHVMLHLHRMFAAAERGRLVSVVLMDVDQLAAINEKHGRSAGDEVLSAVADVLEETTRTMNMSARLGGDEFLAVLDGVSGNGAVVFAEEVQEQLAARRFPWGAVTISAGIAQYEDGMASPEVLLAAADQGLYRAKTGGTSRVVLMERKGRVSGASTTAPAVEKAPAASSNGAGQKGSGETILVVDDEPAVLHLLTKVLMRDGYQVLEAHGPTEAIAYADPGRRIDLVVTDIVMPEMSGFRLVEVLAQRRPALKALYISGYSQDEIEWAGVPGVSKGFLSKPLQPKQFTAAIRQVLDREAQAPAGADAAESRRPDLMRGDSELVEHLAGRLRGSESLLAEIGADPSAAPDILVLEDLTPDLVDRWQSGAEATPDLVIALNMTWQARIQALEAGVIDVLPHDMLAGELEARIAGAIRRGHGRSAASPVPGGR